MIFIKFNYAIGNSTIAQRINLKKHSKRLDFDNKVHWQEEHKMLRVAFPAAFGPSKASFDIQFGFAERSTNSNTSYDMAQFEVCAHRYADISESNYGMALLNDCKYGYKVRENIIDLNLLRAPTYPDADADMGDHQFSYSLLPHSGDLVRSNVQIEAEQVNEKPLFFNGYSSGSATLPILVQGEGVRLETIKKAEKEDCWILRLVETKGDTSTVSLEVNGKARLAETNLIEWEEGQQIFVNGSHKITLTPFEIRSYKLFF